MENMKELLEEKRLFCRTGKTAASGCAVIKRDKGIFYVDIYLIPGLPYAPGSRFPMHITGREVHMPKAEKKKNLSFCVPVTEKGSRRRMIYWKLWQPEALFICRGEENLTDWQKYRHCENRYFPKVNWMITGKCNYNCLHCFNAADNAHP